jgi:hypothetical protein
MIYKVLKIAYKVPYKTKLALTWKMTDKML